MKSSSTKADAGTAPSKPVAPPTAAGSSAPATAPPPGSNPGAGSGTGSGASADAKLDWHRMLRWLEEDGHLSTFRAPANYTNGNTRDRQGRLISCEHDSRRVTRTELDGTSEASGRDGDLQSCEEVSDHASSRMPILRPSLSPMISRAILRICLRHTSGIRPSGRIWRLVALGPMVVIPTTLPRLTFARFRLHPNW